MVGAESAITNGVQGVDTNDQSASFEEVGPGGRLGSGRPVSPVGCPDTVASTRLDAYLVPLGDQRLNSLGGDGYPAIAGPRSPSTVIRMSPPRTGNSLTDGRRWYFVECATGPKSGHVATSPRPENENLVQLEPAKTEEPPAEQGVHMERTTRFEPATLTLAR